MRIASFNTENLFSRARVLNFRKNEEGNIQLAKIAELQKLLKAKVYTNKTQIFNKYQGLKEFIDITEDRGKLFRKSGTAIVGIKANGADDWDGSIQFKRDKFNETTRVNTAKAIKAVKADIFCIVEVENGLQLPEGGDFTTKLSLEHETVLPMQENCLALLCRA